MVAREPECGTLLDAVRVAVSLGLLAPLAWCLAASAQAQTRRTPAGASAAQAAANTTVVTVPPALGRRVGRATVSILLGNRDVGRGAVLAPAGRIVTALALLRGQREVRVRYPDGRVDRARLIAQDEAWGVALLEGFAGRWPEQIALAEGDLRVRDPVAWMPAENLRVSGGFLRRRRSFVGADATLLRDAWEVDPIPAASSAGSALVSLSTGAMVGLVVPPADEETSITGPPIAFGVPLAVLRAVVESAGVVETPWLGMVLEELTPGSSIQAVQGGLRVAVVHRGGPAEAAGLRGGERGDVLLAAEGRALRALSELGEVMQGRRVGDVLTLRVLRDGAIFDVPLTLEARPAER